MDAILLNVVFLFALFATIFLCIMAGRLLYQLLSQGFDWEGVKANFRSNTETTSFIFFSSLVLTYMIAKRIGILKILGFE